MIIRLILLCIGISNIAAAQWSQIYENNDFAGQTDVFFLNADTGFVVGNNSVGGFVLRTHNGGASWDSLRYADYQIHTIFMTSIDTGYISCFYNTQISVMRTIDGGDSWQMVSTDLGTAISVQYSISFFDNDTGIINVQGGWYAITYDGGDNWNVQPDGDLYGTRDTDVDGDYIIGLDGAIVIWANNPDLTFHRDTLTYQGSHYFLKAKDHRFISSAIGQDGQELGYPNGAFGIITIGDVLTRDWNVTYFPYLARVYGVSWPSENIMYAVHSSIYSEGDAAKFFMKSVDGGQTWHRQETIEPGYYGTQQIFCPNDSVCFAVGGYGGRIYKTTNGGGPLLEEVTQVPLSVAEIENDLNFSMAPNPTTGLVTIKSEKEQIKRIEVFDLQGKSVLTTFPKAFTASIYLTKYPSGIYLVQVLAGDKILSGKIVVK